VQTDTSLTGPPPPNRASLQTQQEDQSLKCAGCDFLAPQRCAWCGEEFTSKRDGQVCCSSECREKRKSRRKLEKRILANNERYLHRNRDRYQSKLDGRKEGPRNGVQLKVNTIKRDGGYRAMPINVHVTVTPKFSDPLTHQESIKEAQRKEARTSERQTMPRRYENYCPVCVEVVMRNGVEVRRTKGMYRSKDHDCGEVVVNA
jgi:hypothetical protein